MKPKSIAEMPEADRAQWLDDFVEEHTRLVYGFAKDWLMNGTGGDWRGLEFTPPVGTYLYDFGTIEEAEPLRERYRSLRSVYPIIFYEQKDTCVWDPTQGCYEWDENENGGWLSAPDSGEERFADWECLDSVVELVSKYNPELIQSHDPEADEAAFRNAVIEAGYYRFEAGFELTGEDSILRNVRELLREVGLNWLNHVEDPE